ncbi:MAG: hypothetical protein ACLP8A_15140 [Methylovirgula sp.]
MRARREIAEILALVSPAIKDDRISFDALKFDNIGNNGAILIVAPFGIERVGIAAPAPLAVPALAVGRLLVNQPDVA